jgi:hypothetical protein
MRDRLKLSTGRAKTIIRSDANQMRRMVRCSRVGRAPLGKKFNTVPHPTLLLLLLGSEAWVHNSATA